MKRSLIVALLLIFSAASASPDAWARRQQTRARQTPARGRVVVANDMPGAELGAKINAADKQLGASPGEILVRGGGVISTQAVISPGHTLRFTAGTFRLETRSLWEGAILLKSDTAVVGAGWGTVIVEPPQVGWTVFQSFEDIRSQPAHSGATRGLSITDLKIKGANPAVEGGVRQTISLGNCRDCRVENVWLDGTGVIGVQAGGNGNAGNFADGVIIRKNLFTHVASQTVAVVNGRNIKIDSNTFKNSGRDTRMGMSPIDIEPNNPTDIAQHIEITNNLIDSRGSTFPHGNGIIVQNGAGTRNFGPVLVARNTIIGGELLPHVGGNIHTGIYVAGYTQDVRVEDNVITRVSHSGIRLQVSTRNYVARNKLTSTGTGGIPSFDVQDTTDSEIVDNIVSLDPNSPIGTRVIQETGTTSRNNRYRGNTDGRGPLAPMLLKRQ